MKYHTKRLIIRIKNIANYNIFYIFVTINNITNRHANKPTV